MTKLPVSIVIITNRTDERFLATLDNAQFASEVLVVDNTVGTDWHTLQSEFSFHVLPHPEPITDFSRVRNIALKHVSYHWVLFLDSDEVVSPQSIPIISQVLERNQSDGVVARRSDVFYGKKLEYGEAGNQQVIRMGKKNTIHFVGNVHERAVVTGHLEYTSIEILHYSHPTIHEFIGKVSQYAQLVAQERKSGWWRLLFELLIFPPAKFVHGYFIQGGFLDGWHGLVYAACMSLHSLLVRLYMYEKTFIRTAKAH